MNGQDAGPTVTGDADVIESRPPRITVGLVLALIIAAAVTGYLFGNRAAATPTPAPSTAATTTQPIAASGQRCSAQLQDRLQLGIEIINQSTTTMTLHQVKAVLPLGGLRPTATTWGPCGQLPPAAVGDHPLLAGTPTWLTITFDVLEPCPGPLPVLFTVHYTQAGRPDTAALPGFNDLGDVPYTRCPTVSR